MKTAKVRSRHQPFTKAPNIPGRKTLLTKTQGRCAYCGKPVTPRTMQRDHVEPLGRYRGVRYTFSGRNGCANPAAHRSDNVVACCAPGNKDKGSMDLETWRASLRWPPLGKPVTFWFERLGEN